MDNHATTPMDPRVLRAMEPYFLSQFGNAASRTHRLGWDAEGAVGDGRERLGAFMGAESGKEIVFTPGATEAESPAIKGGAGYSGATGKRIVPAVIEHRGVLDSCRRLETEGFSVTYLGVDQTGRV